MREHSEHGKRIGVASQQRNSLQDIRHQEGKMDGLQESEALEFGCGI